MTLPQGINFRKTSSYVSDGADEYAQIAGALDYPTTTPQGNNVGWESIDGGVISIRNKLTSVDRRLAGLHFSNFASAYRIDLPSAGSYNIRAAFGDVTESVRAEAYLKDSSTQVATLATRKALSADQFIDATDVLHAGSAAWVTNNAPLLQSFSTTILRVQIGGGPTTNDYAIAHLYVEAVAGGATLAGDASGNISATGALTTEIPLSGASIILSSATGAISIPIHLSGVAAQLAISTGDLATQILLGSDAHAAADADADLTIGFTLSGAAVAQALAGAALTTQILLAGEAHTESAASGEMGQGASLSGDASLQPNATATLTTQIQLSSQAVMQALAQGGLTQGSALSGVAGVEADSAGDLSTQILFNADAAAQATASGSIAASAIPLAGEALAIISGAGDLSTRIELAGASVTHVDATGSLTLNLSIAGNAAALMLAGADLTTQIPLSSGAIMQALASATLDGAARSVPQSPGYTVSARRRDYCAEGSGRDYRVTA